jgi:hypothetical protein
VIDFDRAAEMRVLPQFDPDAADLDKGSVPSQTASRRRLTVPDAENFDLRSMSSFEADYLERPIARSLAANKARTDVGLQVGNRLGKNRRP